MLEGWESSEVIVARTYSIILSLALLNDDIDDESQDGLEWMPMKKGDNKKLKKHPIGSHCDVFPIILDLFSHDSFL